MSKSSINVQPVKSNSEKHNNREQKLDYVRDDLSYKNSKWVGESISNCRKEIEEKYFKSVGQKMQSKSTPIREAVLLISEKHTASDLIQLGKKLEQEFGIKTIQAYAHKDEGHRDPVSQEWKPNLHGHMVFNWTDEKGKSIKLKKQDMSKMQDIVAQELGLERGLSSNIEHLGAIQFKLQEEAKNLGKTKEANLRISDVQNYSVSGILGQDNKKTIEGLKSALNAEIKKNAELQLEIQKEKSNSYRVDSHLSKQRTVEKEQLERLAIRADKHMTSPSNKSELSLSVGIAFSLEIAQTKNYQEIQKKHKDRSKELRPIVEREEREQKWKSIKNSPKKDKGLNI